MPRMTRKLVVEAIGTFFLILTIGLLLTSAHPTAFAPLAIGSVLMVMVYAGGHISGAHYNPAVTLAVFLRGKASTNDLVGYWGAQVVGGVIAALLTKYIFAENNPQPALLDLAYAGIAEFIFTFALAFVVLNVATTKGTEGNSYFGLAIGFTVMVGAFAVGSISGGVFNPSVAISIAIIGLAPWSAVPVYLIANLAGGAAAGLLFRALDLGNDKPTTATAREQAELTPAASTKR